MLWSENNIVEEFLVIETVNSVDGAKTAFILSPVVINI